MGRGWGFRRSLLLIALGGLALRVTYVLALRRGEPLANDAFYFTYGANLFAEGHGFIQPHAAIGSLIEGREMVEEAAADHPPLYVLWLSIASVVDPRSGTSPTVHMLWTCVLGAGTVLLCGLIGRRLAGPRTGLIAAAIAAIYPNLWLHDGMLMSEPMAIFTVCLVLWSAYRFCDDPTFGRVAWLGASCGLAALARSEFLLAIPLLMLPLVVTRSRAWRERARWLAVGSATALAAIAPWVAYNSTRFEEPVYMSTNLGVTLAAANCDSTYYGDRIGYKDWACAIAAHESLQARVDNWTELDASQRDEHLRPEATRYIRDHEKRVPLVVAARMARILKLYGVGQELDLDHRVHRHEQWVVYAGLVSWYLLAGMAVAGGVVLRRRRDVPIYPLVAVASIVLIAAAFTFAQTRYRAPAEPVVVLLAAVAADAWLRRRAARRASGDERQRAGPVPGARHGAVARVSRPGAGCTRFATVVCRRGRQPRAASPLA
jgi:4-amino-4-deoxy-L-arabinose transferase-like glycosyltransferase